MKRILTALLLVLSCLSVNGQNLRSGYFLDGYTYRHKMNPAFGGERGYIAIPIAGYTSLGVETSLSLSNILFPTADGGITTFLDPAISVDKVMSGIADINPLAINTDISLISVGFNRKKSYHTIDFSFKADGMANIPADVFSWAKEQKDNFNMSGLGLNAEARMQLSYGYSRSIGKHIRVGARAKLIAGMAKANYSFDYLELKSNSDEYIVKVSGNGYMSAPVAIQTEGPDKHIVGMNILPQQEIGAFLDNAASYGAAFDLGISVDLFKYLTLSAAVLDLGFISWNGITQLKSKDSEINSNDIIDQFDPNADIEGQLEHLADELLEVASIYVTETDGKTKDMLGVTTHLAAEFRMPFWERLAVGALYTGHVDANESWNEFRGSINCAPLRWLSITGNYAYSTFGHSYGAALNIHPALINLFVGLDSFKPVFNISDFSIPSNPLNTNLAFGLNITFGKYRGRYPKK